MKGSLRLFPLILAAFLVSLFASQEAEAFAWKTASGDFFESGQSHLQDDMRVIKGDECPGLTSDETHECSHAIFLFWSWVEDRTGVAAEESGRMTNYGFTASGALASAALPNGITHSHYYNETNRLQRITSNRGLANIADFTYDLHPGGHRERLTEAIGREQVQGERRVTNWEYDELYRLRNESLNGGAGDEQTAIGNVGYTYDKVGNRTSRTVVGGIPLSTYQTVDETYDINDRLTDLDGVTYTHDANGNTRTKNAPHLAEDIYDDQNRLIQRLMGEESSIDILYDADGNRVRKTVREGEKEYVTRYLVDALNPTGYSQVLVEIGPSQSIKSYTYGLDRINQRKHQGGVIHYYAYDGLGSVRYLTDSAGQITERYTYDAFGNLLDPWPATSPSGNIYRYAGEQWDQDLRLYYNRARYLDPGLGRFWTMDEFQGVNRTPASLHKYQYAHNDPVNNVDPSGNFPITLRGVLTTIAVVGTLSGIAAVTIPLYMLGTQIDPASKAQLARIDAFYEGTIEVRSIEEFWEPYISVQGQTQDYGLERLRAQYVDDILFQNAIQGLEALRLLRSAKNVEHAMQVPDGIRMGQSIMNQAGYIWKQNTKLAAGGYWARPPGNPKNLPPPQEYNKLLKGTVSGKL